MTTQTIGGIAIPDTPLVRVTTEYIRDVEDDLLFDHSRRVFLFGALQGRRWGLDPDLELLYVGAMFHDIGLTPNFRDSMLRFEVDGANAAEKFLRDHGLEGATVRPWLNQRPAQASTRPCRHSWTRSRSSSPPTTVSRLPASR
jgi:hypothetical protein